MKSTVASIDDLASSRHAVMAGPDENIVEIVKLAVEAKLSVSFYLSKAQAEAFMAWFWTPERVKAAGVELISKEEERRIHAELGLKLDDFHYAPLVCDSCSRAYGAFDFIKQGISQHGHEALRSVFAMQNALLLQVNPTFVPICPSCQNQITSHAGSGVRPAGFYFGSSYGGCAI